MVVVVVVSGSGVLVTLLVVVMSGIGVLLVYW